MKCKIACRAVTALFLSFLFIISGEMAESKGTAEITMTSPAPQASKESPLQISVLSRTETAAETEMTAVTDSDDEGYARDISKECFFNGHSGRRHNLTDGTYIRDFQMGLQFGIRSLRITAPEGEKIGAIYIQWHSLPVALNIQIEDEDGNWTTVADCEGDFYAQYIPIPNLTDFRIVSRADPRARISICEMKVLTPGTPPDTVQIWQKPGEKVDMILIAGHPDDELLWFGGLLPYYAGELKKNVLVITAAMNRSIRRLELLDALWACGVRTHPIHCVLEDFTTTDMKAVFRRWGGKEKLLEMYTGFYRKYKPDVVMLHDINGEYGHGIHKAVSWLGRECAKLAADASVYTDQVSDYGTWNVPKIYIHLYPENTIQMNWNRSLASFNGKTALQVADDALYWHKTQTEHGWDVKQGGELDNSLFGLYSTAVGPDIEKNDLFEHIHIQ